MTRTIDWCMPSWAWCSNNHNTDGRVNGEAMWDSPTHYDIKDALDEIGNKITVHDSLMMVVIAHGNKDCFMVRSYANTNLIEGDPETYESAYVFYKDLGKYINSTFGNTVNNRKYAVMTIVLQACHSGAALKHLYGDHRIIISATKSDEDAYTETGGFDHWAFIYEGSPFVGIYYPGYLLSMGDFKNPRSVYYSYLKGCNAAENNGWLHTSQPQIDDNFNGLSKQDGDSDGNYASKIYM